MKKVFVIIAVWVLLGFLGYKIAEHFMSKPPKDVAFSVFIAQVASKQVVYIGVQEDQRTLVYLKSKDIQKYRTVSPTDLGPIAIEAIKNGAEVTSKPMSQPAGIWVSILIGVLPVLLLIFFLYRIAKRQGNSANDILGFGKTRAKLTKPEENTVRLKDVISNPGEHEEATDIIGYLNNPGAHIAAKAKFPKGVLLAGPPGVGKTLVAKAIAGEAGVPFYYVAGSDFMEMFVGVGASRVRNMFEAAKKNAPCIIFIDEIDAMAQSRGSAAASGGGAREADQTLMQLLVEMDGFEETSSVIVLAATNRIDTLDAALLRPGRFDRLININLPDVAAREKIIDLNLTKVNRGNDIDTKLIAKGTPGFSGADLANIVNEAALLAAKESRTTITMDDMESAKDKVLMGAESPKKMSEEELKLTAYHEAGHAIIGMLMPGHDPVYKVSIVPRGNALGVTMFIPDEDQYSLSKQKINSKIAGLLGGRVAEELIFGDELVTTGASSDLQRATQYARNMVTKWGFSAEVGLAKYSKSRYQDDADYSEHTAAKIDQEVERILQTNYNTVRELLQKHMATLQAMSNALLLNETLSQDCIKQIMDGTYQE